MDIYDFRNLKYKKAKFTENIYRFGKTILFLLDQKRRGNVLNNAIPTLLYGFLSKIDSNEDILEINVRDRKILIANTVEAIVNLLSNPNIDKSKNVDSLTSQQVGNNKGQQEVEGFVVTVSTGTDEYKIHEEVINSLIKKESRLAAIGAEVALKRYVDSVLANGGESFVFNLELSRNLIFSSIMSMFVPGHNATIEDIDGLRRDLDQIIAQLASNLFSKFSSTELQVEEFLESTKAENIEKLAIEFTKKILSFYNPDSEMESILVNITKRFLQKEIDWEDKDQVELLASEPVISRHVVLLLEASIGSTSFSLLSTLERLACANPDNDFSAEIKQAFYTANFLYPPVYATFREIDGTPIILNIKEALRRKEVDGNASNSEIYAYLQEHDLIGIPWLRSKEVIKNIYSLGNEEKLQYLLRHCSGEPMALKITTVLIEYLHSIGEVVHDFNTGDNLTIAATAGRDETFTVKFREV